VRSLFDQVYIFDIYKNKVLSRSVLTLAVGMHKIRAQNLDSKKGPYKSTPHLLANKKRGHDLKRFVFSLTKSKVYKDKFEEELCGRSNRQSQLLGRKVFRRKFCCLRQAL